MKRPKASSMNMPSKMTAFDLLPISSTTIASPSTPTAISVAGPSESLPRIAPNSSRNSAPTARISSGRLWAMFSDIGVTMGESGVISRDR